MAYLWVKICVRFLLCNLGDFQDEFSVSSFRSIMEDTATQLESVLHESFSSFSNLHARDALGVLSNPHCHMSV